MIAVPDIAGTLTSGVPNGGKGHGARHDGMQVRRLTPIECERLQGFPDNYTQVPYRNKPASDAPRYKALGNSMAVPVMAWIGQRIAAVQQQMDPIELLDRLALMMRGMCLDAEVPDRAKEAMRAAIKDAERAVDEHAT